MPLEVKVKQPYCTLKKTTIEIIEDVTIQELINEVFLKLLNQIPEGSTWICYSKTLNRNLFDNEIAPKSGKITITIQQPEHSIKQQTQTNINNINLFSSNTLQVINFIIYDKRNEFSFQTNTKENKFFYEFNKNQKLQSAIDYIYQYLHLDSNQVNLRLNLPNNIQDNPQYRQKSFLELGFNQCELINGDIGTLFQSSYGFQTTRFQTMNTAFDSPQKSAKRINNGYELFTEYDKQLQYPNCEKHQTYPISHIRLDNEGKKFACVKCLDKNHDAWTFYQFANNYNERLQNFINSIKQQDIINLLKQQQYLIYQKYQTLIDTIISSFQKSQSKVLPKIPQQKYLYDFNDQEIFQVIKFMKNEKQTNLEIENLKQLGEKVQNLNSVYLRICKEEQILQNNSSVMQSVPNYKPAYVKACESLCNMKQSFHFNETSQNLVKVKQNQLEKGKKLTNITLLHPQLTFYEINIPKTTTLDEVVNAMYQWLELDTYTASIDAFLNKKPLNEHEDRYKTIKDLNLLNNQTIDLQVRYINQPLKMFQR